MIENRHTRKSLLKLSQRQQWHPYQVMVYLAMAASGFLFLVLLVAYTVQRFKTDNLQLAITVPKMFIVSTLLLTGSTFSLMQARKMLRYDRLRKTVQFLFITLGLVGLFSISQVAGWYEFYTKGAATPTSNVASLYIYFLSGLHFMHILAAVIFLLVITVPAYRKSLDAVEELIHVTNPYQKEKVDTLLVFWHYLDALWLVLFFYFLLTA